MTQGRNLVIRALCLICHWDFVISHFGGGLFTSWHYMNLHRRTFLKQLGFGAAGLGLVSTFPGCFMPHQEVYGRLPRGTPEEQGVSSTGILRFLAAAAKSTHEFHSFMMVRRGHVIAEGWWAPYRPGANHMLYSLSKSFTATTVGFAVVEGRLTVDDPVASFFSD